MHRYLHNQLLKHYERNRQMIFLSGPRQVGKTTMANSIGHMLEGSRYLNWDDLIDRENILKGPESIVKTINLMEFSDSKPLCIFDELHKYQHWRDFLKSFFDKYESKLKFLTTGSASLRVFSRGGDSLMGRYFPYTLHPISVAECNGIDVGGLVNRQPRKIDEDQWQSLWNFGGFPEPFFSADSTFHKQWLSIRSEQLFRDDLRDLTRIQELGQIQALAHILSSQVGELTSYTYLSKSVRVSVDTIRRWVPILEAFHYCFRVKPWFNNVARALRKEPKYYLWDWSQVQDPGAKAENLIASSLLKATNFWTESGKGMFDLHYVRDKQKREVDFLVTRDRTPWFLIEVKSSSKVSLSSSLHYFQDQTNAKHAFQVAMDFDYVERDCFEFQKPVIVPAKTFLAQLI